MKDGKCDVLCPACIPRQTSATKARINIVDNDGISGFGFFPNDLSDDQQNKEFRGEIVVTDLKLVFLGQVFEDGTRFFLAVGQITEVVHFGRHNDEMRFDSEFLGGFLQLRKKEQCQ